KLLSLAAKRSKPIGRKEKKALQVELKNELLSEALPQISYVDAAMRVKAETLMVFTQGKSQLQRFETLFNQTFCAPFDLSLVRVSGLLLNVSDQEWNNSHEAAEKISRFSQTFP